MENGVAMLMDRTAFAGSVCMADRCIKTMVQKAGLPIGAAVAMMTVNPAKIIGIKTKGILCAGMDADICVFDEDIRIQAVFVGGRKCWCA